nr:putative RNA-dependent RNA polymerase [Binucleate Rhizoctonia mitovirus 15]
MQKVFNLLQAVKSRYVAVAKMIPLSDKIRMRLFDPLALNIVLSQGRVTHLAWRIRLTSQFLSFVLKYNANRGSTDTVKWLKASLVAIQKELGQDRLEHLTPLTPGLAYSKLANGLPRIIPASDRGRIRRGDVRTIRFWTGLFNLYRVLKIPGELKLQTITAPFSGNLEKLEYYISVVQGKTPYLFFSKLPDWESMLSKSLVPTGFVLSRSASPSNKHGAVGILTDIHLMNTLAPDLWQEVLYYLHSVGTKVSSPYLKQLDHGYKLIQRLMAFNCKEMTGVKTGLKFLQNDHLMTKDSLRSHGIGPGLGLSQFALKEEAAGKIRLFALMDSITQSTLAPLHEALFDLLRMIPNDGTFNQEESIRRSQFKAVQAGKAYSFDLTAATDRLPARLTAQIIECIFDKEGMGESWLNLMTQRPFGFNPQVAEKLKLDPEAEYRYAVGQPMGGLSSWAGLAITHHWIVQMAAFRATGSYSWNSQYEILGDDLVIFDRQIADQYLIIMAELGCEINLTKSIVSHSRPVFEFAKRTCWGPHIVSGISIAQVRAGWRVAGRVANVLNFNNSGLLTSPSLLAITLARYAFSNGKPSSLSTVNNSHRGKKYFALGILSLLGTMYQSGILPLRVVMTALVNPHYEEADYSGEAIGLPQRASLHAAFSMLRDATTADQISFSKQEVRDEVYKEYASELATVMLQSALKKAQLLLGNSELLVQQFSARTYYPPVYTEGDSKIFGTKVPMEDLPSDYRLLLIQIENFTNWTLGLEFAKEDPEWLYETIYDLAYKQAKYNHITFEEASRWLERVEALEYKLTLQDKVKPGKTILESAPILSAIRNMGPKVRPSYLRPIHFASVYRLDTLPRST